MESAVASQVQSKVHDDSDLAMCSSVLPFLERAIGSLDFLFKRAYFTFLLM